MFYHNLDKVVFAGQRILPDIRSLPVSRWYLFELPKGKNSLKILVSFHISYRFGRLQKPAEVEFIEPLLDG